MHTFEDPQTALTRILSVNVPKHTCEVTCKCNSLLRIFHCSAGKTSVNLERMFALADGLTGEILAENEQCLTSDTKKVSTSSALAFVTAISCRFFFTKAAFLLPLHSFAPK